MYPESFAKDAESPDFDFFRRSSSIDPDMFK